MAASERRTPSDHCPYRCRCGDPEPSVRLWTSAGSNDARQPRKFGPCGAGIRAFRAFSSGMSTLLRMRRVLLPLALTVLMVPTTTAAHASYAGEHATVAGTTAVHHQVAREPMPKLKIRTVVRHLDHPWDVKTLPGGTLIFTQRDRATLSVLKKGKVRKVEFPSSSVWVSGETGLMGLEVDPNFADNHRIYTCQGGFTGT